MIKFKHLFRKSSNPEVLSIEDAFSNLDYQLHNIARLSHLDGIGLDLHNKTVIEFGAGIGDHTYFYLLKGCKVLATDARPELLQIINQKYGVETMVLDIESDIDKICSLRKFDIIHCYGILYHINNPGEFLRSLKGKGSIIILETCVSSDFKNDKNYIVNENKYNPTQAFSGTGSRPTRKWIFSLLKELFPFVYVPKTQPTHPEFPLDWDEDFQNEESNLKRAIFIGSEHELGIATLIDYLPKLYNKM